MSPTLQLILALGLVIFTAKAAGLIFTRLHQPSVLGELVVGLVLGPSVLNLFGADIFHSGHPQEILLELAEIGVILLMFVAGMEVDLREMLETGRVALLAGIFGVAVPLVLGALLALPFGYSLLACVFIGLILTATSVSISAQTLLELGVLKSREGLALLGAAVVDDVLVIFVLSLFLALTGDGRAGPAEVVGVVARMLLFGIGAVLVGRFLIEPVTRRIVNLPISEGVIAWVLVATLLYAWAAEAVGQIAAITGAFLAGIFFARTGQREEIERGMHTITYSLFVPIFLVSIGLRADARTLSANGWTFAVALTLIAIVSKVIGAGLGARAAGFDNRASLRVGVGMISRGEVGLIVAAIGMDVGLVDAPLFSAVVVMVLLTTLVTPPLLRWVLVSKEGVEDDTPARAGGG